MVVIVWYMDLQLPVQTVPITTKIVNSNLFHGEVYSIQHYVIKFVSEDNKRWIFIKYCVEYYYTYFAPVLFVSDDNKWWIFIKYCVDYYYTHFVPVLFKMLL